MAKGTTPSIAFNRIRNDVHRLIGLEYISPELRNHAKMMLPLLDMMEAKFSAAFFAHTELPSKLTTTQVNKLEKAREHAVQQAQLAVIKREPLSNNPYPAGALHDLWRKGWWFYTVGAPGGNQAFHTYVPPEDD